MAIQLLPNLPPEIAAALDSLESPSALADFLAGIVDIPVREKQDLLETFEVTQLLDKLLGVLANYPVSDSRFDTPSYQEFGTGGYGLSTERMEIDLIDG